VKSIAPISTEEKRVQIKFGGKMEEEEERTKEEERTEHPSSEVTIGS